MSTASGGSDAAEPSPLDPATRHRVLRQGLSVGVATGAYGISFGALAVTAGLDVGQACALSLLMFTGGSQFAFVGIIATGGLASAPSAIAAASMLGLRNALYALELTRLLDVRGHRRVAAAHLTIDESMAVAVAQNGVRAGRLGFWVTGISVFVLWNVTTLAGALVGGAIGDPRTYGLDAAACAAFVALLWPRLRGGRDAVAVALAGAAVATLLTPTLPPGIPVVVAAATALLARRSPREGIATTPEVMT